MKEKFLAQSLLVIATVALVSCHTSTLDHNPKSDHTSNTQLPATSNTPKLVSIHKSPNDDRQYAAFTLPNGLQAVLVSDPTLENAAATLALPVGSAQDPAEFEGLAHYLEHMLFLGTAKYPEPDALAKFVQLNNGATNASTYKDKTYYLFQVNAGKFDEALDIFSDYFKSPTFDKTYADKQRHAVDSEWSMQRGQYVWNLWRLNDLTANPMNPHSQFSIGNLQTLSDKPGNSLQDNMKAFYERYYSANLMKLTLVGKQSIPELAALAQKHFGSIANKNIAKPEITEPGLTNAQFAQHIHYKPTQDVKALFIDFPVKSNRDQWRLKPNEYLINLLSSQEQGTLFEQMRTQGLVTSMSAFIEAENYGPDGFLRIEAELTDKGLKHQDQLIAATFAYVELLKREGLNARYYAELQTLNQKKFLTSDKPAPLDQAINLAVQQLYLPVENLLNADSIYERYDEATIKNLLNQLEPHKVRIWSISKNEKAAKDISFFDGKYTVTPISAERFAQWDKQGKKLAFNLPPLNNLFSSESAPVVDNPHSKPYAVVSRAGVEAFVVQPQFYREDKGHLAVEINSLLGHNSPKNVAAATLLNRIFAQQNASLIDRATRATLELSIDTSATNSPEINISGYTGKHAFLLNELLKNFATLNISQQEFATQLDSYQQELNNYSKAKVVSQMFNQLYRLTGKYDWTNEEILAASKTLTLPALVNYYKAIKKDPLLRIYASGNYSEADVKAIAESAAVILPGHRLPENRKLPPYAIPQGGQWKTHQASVDLEDNGLIQAWFTESNSYAERAQMEVLDALFYPAIYSQLRTNEQLGYVVDGGYFPIANTTAFFMAVQSANTNLVDIKARLNAFRTSYIETVKATDDAEFEKIKQAKIASLKQKPTDFNREAAQYAREFWRADYQFNDREQRIAAMEKVTKADVIQLYEKLLLNNKSSGIFVQLRGTKFKTADFSQR